MSSPEAYLAYLQEKCPESGHEALRAISRSEFFDEIVAQAAKNLASFWEMPDKVGELEVYVATELKKAEQIRPTDSQETPIFLLLKRHEERIVGMLNEETRLKLPRIVFGSLPTGDPNAIAIQAPGGIVIAFNNGLIHLLMNLTAAVSSFVPYHGKRGEHEIFGMSKEDIGPMIRTNIEGHLRFAVTLFCYLALGDPGLYTYSVLDPPHHHLAFLMEDTAIAFCVAHEYFHVLMRHLSSSTFYRRRLIGKLEVKEIPRSWEEEIAADAGALRMTIERHRGVDLDIIFSYLGVDFLFSCVEMLEQAIGTDSPSSHPPASLRRHLLRTTIRNHFPEHSQHILTPAESVQDLIAELWKIHRPNLQKWVEKTRNASEQDE
jgi:hypothetical protein